MRAGADHAARSRPNAHPRPDRRCCSTELCIRCGCAPRRYAAAGLVAPTGDPGGARHRDDAGEPLVRPWDGFLAAELALQAGERLASVRPEDPPRLDWAPEPARLDESPGAR